MKTKDELREIRQELETIVRYYDEISELLERIIEAEHNISVYEESRR